MKYISIFKATGSRYFPWLLRLKRIERYVEKSPRSGHNGRRSREGIRKSRSTTVRGNVVPGGLSILVSHLKSCATKTRYLSPSPRVLLRFTPGNIRASQRVLARVENETRSYHTGQVSIQRWRTSLDIPREQFAAERNFDRVIIVLGGLETISIGLLKSGWPTL